MKKLPFKITPKQNTKLVGDEASGVLEIPVLGGLKVGEQIAVDEAIRSLPNTFAEASRLAVKVDAEQELGDLLFAFDIVATPSWEEYQKEEIEILQSEGKLSPKEAQKRQSELEAKAKIFRQCRIRYAPDILALNANSEQAGRAKQLAAVSAILAHRVDDSWTTEDSKDLSDALFQKIWEFAQDEMTGEAEPEKPTAETVGKQLEEKSENPSTGESSTGESSTTGQEIPALAV
ncbi:MULTISPECIES: hypothetical protein [Cyanophyceae]|uniref:hypothetical protein n=1 Tax=Cyanophyceae TaxID=3028117 RepID=UPI0016821E5D|nr:hypothetical protein [Trichocoleus sp. FACHB-40]MBD2005615.1 hypothetical protein [Trichocoleus sp. FACHB-40]